MRKILFRGSLEAEIYFDEIDSEDTPIFAKENGKLCGMITYEGQKQSSIHYGWILRTGGTFGAYGYRGSLGACIEAGIKLGFTFFVE